MSNTAACVTLDAMYNVCGAHCATWVGEDDAGNRECGIHCLRPNRLANDLSAFPRFRLY